MHEVRDVSEDRNNTSSFIHLYSACSIPKNSNRASLFDGQRMRPGHGQLVEEHEELPEGLEEWPSGQQADALVGVDGSVGDHLLLYCGDNAQLDLLLLAQQLHRIRLVELDRGTVDLQPARKQNTHQHYFGTSLQVPAIRGLCWRLLTFSPEEMVRTNVEKTGRGSRVLGAQHSMLAPMGKQKRGTDSDRGNDS